MKKVMLTGLTLILISCNFPAQERVTDNDLAVPPIAEAPITELEPTFTPMPEHESVAGNAPLTPPPGTQECAWKWNSQSLPEQTADLQAALAAAGLNGSIGVASAFGEDCIDPKTETVSYFAAMQTEFKITLPVEDLSDLDALGGCLGQVLLVLELFPPESTPGPIAGRVSIIFEAGAEQEIIYFNQDEGAMALKEGLGGAALLEALGYQP